MSWKVPSSTGVRSSPKFKTWLRSGESAVCLSRSSSWSRLDLPELFGPNSAVIGARRTRPLSRHDLKPWTTSFVSIEGSLNSLLPIAKGIARLAVDPLTRGDRSPRHGQFTANEDFGRTTALAETTMQNGVRPVHAARVYPSTARHQEIAVPTCVRSVPPTASNPSPASTPIAAVGEDLSKPAQWPRAGACCPA